MLTSPSNSQRSAARRPSHGSLIKPARLPPHSSNISSAPPSSKATATMAVTAPVDNPVLALLSLECPLAVTALEEETAGDEVGEFTIDWKVKEEEEEEEEEVEEEEEEKKEDGAGAEVKVGEGDDEDEEGKMKGLLEE